MHFSYLDLEEKSQLDAGIDFCSGLIKTFCGKLEAAGYFAGFYTSASYARRITSGIKQLIISVTTGVPFVIVPVLSRATISVLPAASRLAAFL